jgi:hypothetical protein
LAKALSGGPQALENAAAAESLDTAAKLPERIAELEDGA